MTPSSWAIAETKQVLPAPSMLDKCDADGFNDRQLFDDKCMAHLTYTHTFSHHLQRKKKIDLAKGMVMLMRSLAHHVHSVVDRESQGKTQWKQSLWPMKAHHKETRWNQSLWLLHAHHKKVTHHKEITMSPEVGHLRGHRRK